MTRPPTLQGWPLYLTACLLGATPLLHPPFGGWAVAALVLLGVWTGWRERGRA